MTYDDWKLRSDLDGDLAPRRRLYQCDVCGELKPNCRMVWVSYAGDTIVCESCLDTEERDNDR